MTPTPRPTPLPTSPTSDGWVTFQHATIPGVGAVLVQKRDGCTRTVRAGSR